MVAKLICSQFLKEGGAAFPEKRIRDEGFRNEVPLTGAWFLEDCLNECIARMIRYYDSNVVTT